MIEKAIDDSIKAVSTRPDNLENRRERALGVIP